MDTYQAFRLNCGSCPLSLSLSTACVLPGQRKQCVVGVGVSVVVFGVVLRRVGLSGVVVHTVLYYSSVYPNVFTSAYRLPPLQVHTIESAVAASTSRE